MRNVVEVEFWFQEEKGKSENFAGQKCRVFSILLEPLAIFKLWESLFVKTMDDMLSLLLGAIVLIGMKYEL